MHKSAIAFLPFFNTATFFTFTKEQGKNNKGEHPHCFLSFIFIVPLEYATKTDLLPTKDTKMNERRERERGRQTGTEQYAEGDREHGVVIQ